MYSRVGNSIEMCSTLQFLTHKHFSQHRDSVQSGGKLIYEQIPIDLRAESIGNSHFEIGWKLCECRGWQYYVSSFLQVKSTPVDHLFIYLHIKPISNHYQQHIEYLDERLQNLTNRWGRKLAYVCVRVVFFLIVSFFYLYHFLLYL